MRGEAGAEGGGISGGGGGGATEVEMDTKMEDDSCTGQ